MSDNIPAKLMFATQPEGEDRVWELFGVRMLNNPVMILFLANSISTRIGTTQYSGPRIIKEQ